MTGTRRLQVRISFGRTTGTRNGRKRPALRTAVVAGATLAATLIAVAPSATAASSAVGPTSPDIYVACGYGSVAPSGSSCSQLGDVLTSVMSDNAASAPAATIELLPGDYCPIDISSLTSNQYNILYRRLTIEGVGLSTEDPNNPVSLDGPEAGISTFQWSKDFCSGSPNAMVSIENDDWGPGGYTLTLRNLALDGTANGDDTGNPSMGVYAVETSMLLDDVLVENFASGDGVYYADGEDTGLQVENSAFTGNEVGANIGGGSIDDSTFATNTTGVQTDNLLNMSADTITQNTDGFNLQSDFAGVAIANSIVANNATEDCDGTNGWEATESGLGASGHNLLGPTCPVGKTNSDLAWDSTGLTAAPAENGGPTPTVVPGGDQAGSLGDSGWCGYTDQREYLNSGGDACDAGAYNSSADGTPEAGNGSYDFGSFHYGDTAPSADIGFSNSGGGLLNVFSVAIKSGPFTIASGGDSCTWAVLMPTAASCDVEVTAVPTGQGEMTGTLAIQTSEGETDITLTADALPPRPDAITVASTADDAGDGTCGSDPTTCTLRQAIDDLAPGGTITVPAGTYTLSQGELDVEQPETIVGAGARTTSIVGDGSDRVLDFDADNDSLSGVTVTGGQSNYAAGILVDEGASLSLDHSTVDGNTAYYDGGGIENDGTLTITASTISNNEATEANYGTGGGIGSFDASMEIVNSTIAGNSAASGGGVTVASGSADAAFSTIADNTSSDGGGFYLTTEEEEGAAKASPHLARLASKAHDSDDPDVTAEDDVIATNTGGSGTANCDGSLDSGGHNVASDTSCGLAASGDLQSANAQLGALANNGGDTDTLLPGSTSPAIDAASDSDCADLHPKVDQRDVARPVGAHCDSGSVEAGGTTPHADATRLTPTAATTTSIYYGKSATLSTTLTDTTTGHAISGVTVTLSQRPGTSGSFHRVTSATTASSGMAKLKVTPKVNTQYVWTYAATAAHQAATSKFATITVSQVVHATLVKKTVTAGHKAVVYGTVSPTDNHKKVVLQQFTHGAWKALRITATIHLQKLPNHKHAVGFVLKLKTHHHGKLKLRVARAATATNTAGNSSTLHLTVH